MTEQELVQLIAKGESETLELLASTQSPITIARHLATFANTKGGILVLGVKEPSQFVGVNVHRAKAMLKTAQKYLSPKIVVDVEEHVINNHPIVLVHIKASAELVSAEGGYYRRVGDRSKPMEAAEIRAHAALERNDDKAVSELSNSVAAQTKIIDQLRKDFEKANSLTLKIVIALIGAGAGALLKHFVDSMFS